MKFWIIAVVIAILAVVVASCAAATQKPSPSAFTSASPAQALKITPADAKSRLDSEQGIVLLDVRTDEEYAGGHIAGSILLPVDNLAALAASKLPDKSATIFVYCRSGRRSAIAARQLVEMGYTGVYDLGGIIDWPYEVVK